MRELASILVAYTGVAAAFAGSARASRPRWVTPRAKPILSILSAVAFVVAALLWPHHDGAVLAGVAIVMVVSVTASGFVLLEPLAPRIVWRTAAVASVLAAVLAVTLCLG